MGGRVVHGGRETHAVKPPATQAPGREPLPATVPAEWLQLFGAGRLDELDALLDRSDQDSLVTRVLRADVNCRRTGGDIWSVRALYDEVLNVQPEGCPLRAWVRASLAEQLWIYGDPTSFLVARQGLDELMDLVTAEVPTAVVYARGRLARIVAGTPLFLPTDTSDSDHDAARPDRQLRDLALRDLLHCRLPAEVTFTRGAFAGLQATVSDADIRENHHLLQDARDALTATDPSSLAAVLDFMLVIVTFEVGHLRGWLAACRRLEATSGLPEALLVVVPYSEAFFRMIHAGAQPHTIERIDTALARVRDHPTIEAQWRRHAAMTLADMATSYSISQAARYCRLAGELPSLSALDGHDQLLLERRVAVLRGEPVAADAVISEVAWLADNGRRRSAGRYALRLAHDYAHAGRGTEALALHAWGLARLPRASRRSVWEHGWAQIPEPRAGRTGDRVPGSRPGPAPAHAPAGSSRPPVDESRRDEPRSGGPVDAEPAARAPVVVHVMAPELDLRVNGHVRTIGDRQARLLLALVVAHPRPVHAEQVGAWLWPDASPSASRSRLSTVLHRLRSDLSPAAAVHRRGDVIGLDGDLLTVDLWDQRSAWHRSDPDARRGALTSVKGNLCDLTFPYDDALIESRHQVIAAWLACARAALAAGDLEPTDLLPALEALQLSLDDL